MLLKELIRRYEDVEDKDNKTLKNIDLLKIMNGLDIKEVVTFTCNDGYDSYIGDIKNGVYWVEFKPHRAQLNICYSSKSINKIVLCEIYKAKKGYAINTRGGFLQHLTFTKTQKALKDLLIASCYYYPKQDMKHHLQGKEGLPLDITLKALNRLLRLDFNLVCNDFIKEGELLDSTKATKTIALEEEEEA